MKKEEKKKDLSFGEKDGMLVTLHIWMEDFEQSSD